MKALNELARVVTFGAVAHDDISDDIEFDYRTADYEGWFSGVFDETELRAITTKSFVDFEILLTTGNFDVALVLGPENMRGDVRKRLDDLITNAAAVVKGFVIVTKLERDVLPAESGDYGYVVRTFTPNYRNVSVIHKFVLAILDAPDFRPSTTFVPSWEDTTRSFKMSFDEWPPEVATACEQYLLYFRDFLADIGIKSSTNLAHEAGEVLFSVVPDDPEEALDAIHDALALYLRLPTITEGTSVAVTGDISALRLQSQIDHTKSQMMLAAATIREQQATIRKQEATIETQQIAISLLKGVNPTTDILLNASKSDTPKSRNSEEAVLWGWLILGDVEVYKGIKIPAGEIVRRAKIKIAERKGQKQLSGESNEIAPR